MGSYYDNKYVASIVEEMLTPTNEASYDKTVNSKEFTELINSADSSFQEARKLAKAGEKQEAKGKYLYALKQYTQLRKIISTVDDISTISLIIKGISGQLLGMMLATKTKVKDIRAIDRNYANKVIDNCINAIKKEMSEL